MSSVFRGAQFDWHAPNPSRTWSEGLLILSGEIVVYAAFTVDQFMEYYRPITRRVAGDPRVGGTTYVDYWGGNPSGELITEPWREEIAGSTVTYYGTQYTAILSGFTRRQPLPPGKVHFCEVEFTIVSATQNEIVVPPRTPPL